MHTSAKSMKSPQVVIQQALNQQTSVPTTCTPKIIQNHSYFPLGIAKQMAATIIVY